MFIVVISLMKKKHLMKLKMGINNICFKKQCSNANLKKINIEQQYHMT